MLLRSVFGAFLALALGGIVAGQAAAGQCGYAQCWGAVGIGPNGAYGFSHEFAYESDAVNAAQSGCQGNCNNIRTFYNTCGAMAEGNYGAWGFGWAATRKKAESKALGYCRQNGGNCRIRVWSCSP